tara:strand:- start:237 stop:719 length:483 start_codon:yes stop_codon:yes gene_type:complete
MISFKAEMSYRAIAASDSMGVKTKDDLIVTEWPCRHCPFAKHCKITGEECQAWCDYNNTKFDGGPWSAHDRVPFSLAGTTRLQRKDANVTHAGQHFIRGSMSETAFLIIEELGVASSADVADVFKRRKIRFCSLSLKAAIRRMGRMGALKKLPRSLWSVN